MPYVDVKVAGSLTKDQKEKIVEKGSPNYSKMWLVSQPLSLMWS